MWRKCVTSTPMSDDANPRRSAALRASTVSWESPRTVATTERCSGRPWLRASRSRSAVAESTPMSTCTSPSAPRSTSSMRCAEKSRRRRLRRPSASPSDAGARCTAMSHSVCTLSSGASHPAPTGWPGRRRSACPRAITSPMTAYFGCSYQLTVDVEAVSDRGEERVTIEAHCASRRSRQGDRSLARRLRREPRASGRSARRGPGGYAGSPSRICSVQWRCIAASSCACGPSPDGASGAASRRTRTSSCIGALQRVTHPGERRRGRGLARWVEGIDVELAGREHRRHPAGVLAAVAADRDPGRERRPGRRQAPDDARSGRPRGAQLARRPGARDGAARSPRAPSSSRPTRRWAFSAVITDLSSGMSPIT